MVCGWVPLNVRYLCVGGGELVDEELHLVLARVPVIIGVVCGGAARRSLGGLGCWRRSAHRHRRSSSHFHLSQGESGVLAAVGHNLAVLRVADALGLPQLVPLLTAVALGEHDDQLARLL